MRGQPLFKADLTFESNFSKDRDILKIGDDFVDCFAVSGAAVFDLGQNFTRLYFDPRGFAGDLGERTLDVYLDGELAFSLASWAQSPGGNVSVALDGVCSMKIEFEGYDDDFAVMSGMTVE